MLLFCFHLFVKLPNCYKLMLWCVIFSAFMFGDNYGMTVIILSTCLCVMLTICTVNWTLAWSPPILISFNIVIYFMAFACTCIVFFLLLYDQITRQESLKTDLTTLIALCEKADNDIRSCLNTLQVFLSDFLLVCL